MLFIKKSNIFISIIIIFISLLFSKYNPQINDARKKENNYIIEISKINLNVSFSFETTLDNGLEINKLSKVSENPLIISGHSGPGPNVFFNELEYLNIDDEIIIYHNNKKAYFKINDIITFKKYSDIVLPKDENYIYLITCDKYDMQKQLIISAKLVKIEEK